MKSTENTAKKRLKIIYIGKDKTISQSLNSIHDFEINYYCYDNPILAYHDITNHQSDCDIIICDSKIQGLDISSFFEKISHLKAKKFLLGNNELSNKKIADFKKNKIEDVFTSPIDPEAFGKRLQFVFGTFAKRQSNKKTQIRFSFLKRIFDVFFAFCSLAFLSPILFLVAIAIKFDSKGPVFFTSKRVGAGYKVFNFYKFRTMKIGAENMVDDLKDLNQYQTKTENLVEYCENCSTLSHACSEMLIVDGQEICENFYQLKQKNDSSSFLKFKNDPRVTKLGEFLRKTSIDELPQLLNILKGDMSFVGNRPLPLYEAEQLTSDQWALRFMAPAGLTGLWQVRKRGQKDMSEEERKQLDNSYARNHSFLKDILLILQTFPALTQKENV
ncbi:MAG: sugar transferase [Flavobacteriia bacterium]|jgi:lipopolysaccharide/colanic/teichoic acid biosynthesis glycosyltransferase